MLENFIKFLFFIHDYLKFFFSFHIFEIYLFLYGLNGQKFFYSLKTALINIYDFMNLDWINFFSKVHAMQNSSKNFLIALNYLHLVEFLTLILTVTVKTHINAWFGSYEHFPEGRRFFFKRYRLLSSDYFKSNKKMNVRHLYTVRISIKNATRFNYNKWKIYNLICSYGMF